MNLGPDPACSEAGLDNSLQGRHRKACLPFAGKALLGDSGAFVKGRVTKETAATNISE